jgi:hypothetical protein
MDVATGVLVAATVANAVACGATLDQTFKQLPARHRIGAAAYVAYARAADLSNGLIWYPIMGIGATLLSIAAVVTGLIDHRTGERTAALIVLAVGTALFTAATARAAPTLLTLRRGTVTDAVAEATLARFARFNAIRAAGIVVALASTVWALVATIA